MFFRHALGPQNYKRKFMENKLIKLLNYIFNSCGNIVLYMCFIVV